MLHYWQRQVPRARGVLLRAGRARRAQLGAVRRRGLDRRLGDGRELRLDDLPGTYSLSARSAEEQIAIADDPDLAAIQTQFHHLLRTVPSLGRVILPHGEAALEETLARGCWSEVERFGEQADPGYRLERPDGSRFTVMEKGTDIAVVD